MNIRFGDHAVGPYEIADQSAVLARRKAAFQPLVERGWVPFGEKDGLTPLKAWTDDYVNILEPLVAMTAGKGK